MRLGTWKFSGSPVAPLAMWRPTEASILDHQALSANRCLAPWVCFQRPSDRNPCSLRGEQGSPSSSGAITTFWLGLLTPWLQVNSLTLPSPTSLVTGEGR